VRRNEHRRSTRAGVLILTTQRVTRRTGGLGLYLPEGQRKIRKSLNHASRCPGQDSNRGTYQIQKGYRSRQLTQRRRHIEGSSINMGNCLSLLLLLVPIAGKLAYKNKEILLFVGAGIAQSVHRRVTGWTVGVRFPAGPQDF
jgi:hypothetical protein